MDLIITLLVGALIGWLASMIMKTDEQQGALANIVVGIVGSWLGAWVFGDLLNIGGATAAGSFNFWGIIWGVVGAVLLIWILRMLRVLK